MNSIINATNMIKGMTDSELEYACENKPTGIAPWVYWVSEHYSLGKCMRYITKYPKNLPLYVYADHGVGLSSNPFPHDLESKAKVYFTWNPVKEKRNIEFSGKKVIRIPHPWILYRRSIGIKRSVDHSGTLVFLSHSTPDVVCEGHDKDDYFDKLKKLPDKYKPIVLCLHMNDVIAGAHIKLRKHGFPIVTAGNTSSINFVDNFYNIVTDFSYATSPLWGSQVAYCVELGIPYFYLGDSAILTNVSDKNIPDGIMPEYWDDYHRNYIKEAESLFEKPVDNVTAEQCKFIETVLGLDSDVTPQQVSKILWCEFFKSWRQWSVMLRTSLIWLLGKLGFLNIIRKLKIFICN